jgi:hypothetical protein
MVIRANPTNCPASGNGVVVVVSLNATAPMTMETSRSMIDQRHRRREPPGIDRQLGHEDRPGDQDQEGVNGPVRQHADVPAAQLGGACLKQGGNNP